MSDEKEEIFVVVYEMCPGGVFSQRRDWAWIPATSPEDALEKFNKTYAYLVKEGICMLYIAKVILPGLNIRKL